MKVKRDKRSVYNRVYREKKAVLKDKEASGIELILERRYTTQHKCIQSQIQPQPQVQQVGGRVEPEIICEEVGGFDDEQEVQVFVQKKEPTKNIEEEKIAPPSISNTHLSNIDDTYCDKIRGIPFCKGDFMTLLLGLIIRLKLSLSGIGVLLDFLLMLIPDLEFIRSTYKYRQFWERSKVSQQKHFVCGTCNRYEENSCCSRCNSDCGIVIFVSLVDQLRQRLANADFYRKCQYYRDLSARNCSRITDIYDGEVYKKLAEPITKSGHGLSFSMSWDGAKKAKSGRKSAWPLFVTVNEIDPEYRYRPENTLLVSVWYGTNRPSSNALFVHFVEELLQLEKGIECTDPDGFNFLLKGRLINSSMDLPAKADALNLKHHGGYHSCCYCLISGFKSDINNKIYYPIGSNANIALRTSESWKFAYTKLSEGHPEYQGICGVSIFSKLPYWSPALCQSIDVMHLVSNIHKSLIKQWSKIIPVAKWKQFDLELQSQRIHGVFKRPVRSLIEDGSYYKCSEALVFILYMSPLLEHYLSQQYFQHHMLLAESLTRLLGPVTTYDLDMIGRKLKEYATQYQRLYSEDVTLNTHLLIHLSLCVRQHGPLWCYSCFPYESLNKVLMDAIHGTHHVETRIVESVLDFQILSRRAPLLNSNAAVCFFTKHNIILKKRWVDAYKVEPGVTVHHLKTSSPLVDEYNKLMYHGFTVECSRGPSKKKKDDSMVFLKSGLVVVITRIYYDKVTSIWKVEYVDVSGHKGVTVLTNIECPAIVVRKANSRIIASSKLHSCIRLLMR